MKKALKKSLGLSVTSGDQFPVHPIWYCGCDLGLWTLEGEQETGALCFPSHP